MNLKKYMLTCFHMLAICSGLQKAYTQPVQRMIVFIHGTILPVPHPKAAFSWFKGDGYLNGLRFDGMYSHQAIGNEGLHEIEDYHHASSPYTSCSVELKRLFELQYNNFGDLEEIYSKNIIMTESYTKAHNEGKFGDFKGATKYTGNIFNAVPIK